MQSQMHEPIAVVGATGRYAGAPDLTAFWEIVVAGADSISEIPPTRWDWRNYADEQAVRRGRYTGSRWGGFLDGVELFDPVFFGVLPKDAAAVDPHERLFLEECWRLLEQAGYLGPSGHEPSTGVFVGVMHQTYAQMGAASWPQGSLLGPRSGHWSTANRVSHFFDLRGPSLAVDTACSSSLLAVHLACESIRRGECRAAIAGGVNLVLHPAHYASLSAMKMLARDGACKTFDARADGFVPGEGVGAVLLKSLDAALRDGDEVWGVIRGSHLVSEGRTLGYTVPSPAAQAELVSRALERSGVPVRTIGYVEAHGTGTALGDPIEIEGLTRAYTSKGAKGGSCAIGSVKENIGHTEAAAGIAGLTKALLQVRHGVIGPSAHLQQINPRIDFDGSPFRPVREPLTWSATGHPRRAAVSAFGAGGSDVHVILEQHDGAKTDPAPRSDDWTGPQVLLLSARTAEQLSRLADATAASLDQGPLGSVALSEIARTSQTGRREMRERLAVVAEDTHTLRDRLAAFVAGHRLAGVHVGRVRGQTALDGQAMPPPRDPHDAARAWCAGAAIDWSHSWGKPRFPRAPLPPYPLKRKRFWVSLDDMWREERHD